MPIWRVDHESKVYVIRTLLLGVVLVLVMVLIRVAIR